MTSTNTTTNKTTSTTQPPLDRKTSEDEDGDVNEKYVLDFRGTAATVKQSKLTAQAYDEPAPKDHGSNNNTTNNNKGSSSSSSSSTGMVNVPINDKKGPIMAVDPTTKTATATTTVVHEELQEFPEWKEGVDRFTNFVTKEQSEPKAVFEDMKKIVEDIRKDAKTPYAASSQVFTYIPYKNYLMCKIAIDEYMITDFTIGVFKHDDGKSLIDIQELSGEHLTFSQFLEEFKSALAQRQIAEIATFTQEFMNSYGLDMQISLEAFC